MHNEVVLWPFFQSATGNIIHFLPWDPGQILHHVSTKSNALKCGLVVMLTTSSGVACLQANSVHEIFLCSVAVNTITKCMMVLAVLQPCPSWESSLLVQW
jgi:hypothetical protein